MKWVYYSPSNGVIPRSKIEGEQFNVKDSTVLLAYKWEEIRPTWAKIIQTSSHKEREELTQDLLQKSLWKILCQILTYLAVIDQSQNPPLIMEMDMEFDRCLVDRDIVLKEAKVQSAALNKRLDRRHILGDFNDESLTDSFKMIYLFVMDQMKKSVDYLRYKWILTLLTRQKWGNPVDERIVRDPSYDMLGYFVMRFSIQSKVFSDYFESEKSKAKPLEEVIKDLQKEIEEKQVSHNEVKLAEFIYPSPPLERFKKAIFSYNDL